MPMRIVHLATHDLKGGAARSAWRLHQGLRGIGVDSRMVVRSKWSNDPTVAGIDDSACAVWHERILTPYIVRRLPQGSPWFTSGVINMDIAAHPWVQGADVVHLHWVAEWLSASAIGELLKIHKVVCWSLHDLWAVTCGSHFPGCNTPQDDTWQTASGLPSAIAEIGRREFQRKCKLLACRQIQTIAPSRWIGQMAKASIIGSRWPVESVPYGVDTSVFRNADQSSGRARWNLPSDKVLLLFGCANVAERRKGLHLLIEALSAIGFKRESVALVIFGDAKTDLPELSIQVHRVGHIANDSTLASLYAAADAYICAAIEDNLPNTVIEALACGTPVIGFNAGGLPDLVVNGQNGLLAPCGDVKALAAHLFSFVTNPAMLRQMQAVTRNADKAVYSIETQARRCRELYQRLDAKTSMETTEKSLTLCDAYMWRPNIEFVDGESGWIMKAAVEALENVSKAQEKFEDIQNSTESHSEASLSEASGFLSNPKGSGKTASSGVKKLWTDWCRRVIGK